MRRLRLEIAYDGSEFHGWQVQPGLNTIQGTLEAIISEIEGAAVHVEASGRTDAGVHAMAQVAAVSIRNPIPADNFRRAVNRLLPTSIRISRVQESQLSFHPRFHAIRKLYEYRIFREEVCPPFIRNFVCHHPYPLDEPAMVEAAPLLEGQYDFTCFAAGDPSDVQGKSNVRSIFRSALAREGPLLVYRVTGSGFLKHMVRNIVGVLLEVGRGNLGAESLIARLKPGAAIAPGPTAAPQGLFLISVDYDEDRAEVR